MTERLRLIVDDRGALRLALQDGTPVPNVRDMTVVASADGVTTATVELIFRPVRDIIAAIPAATPTVQEAAKVDSFDTLISEARAEAEKAMRRFPQPNYVISKVAEEAGEVVKAAIHCAEGRETTENVRGEMKQLIAMLYRLWVEGDQVHGLRAIAGDNRDEG